MIGQFWFPRSMLTQTCLGGGAEAMELGDTREQQSEDLGWGRGGSRACPWLDLAASSAQSSRMPENLFGCGWGGFSF